MNKLHRARLVATTATFLAVATSVIVACVGDDSPAGPATPDSDGGDAASDTGSPEPEPPDAGSKADADADAAADAGPACDKTKPFATPVEVTELNGTPSGGARLTADMRTVYFHAGGGSAGRLYMATRASSSGPFGTPVLVPGLTTSAQDGGAAEHATIPALSPDGLTIYFQSFRSAPAPSATVNLWTATRGSAGASFGAPSLVPEINGAENTGQPFVTASGTTLYFSPRRGGSGAANVFIHRAPISAQGVVGPGEPVDELLSATSREEAPVLTVDELTIFFARDYDVWSATRADTQSAFSNLASVPNVSDETGQDFPTWISPDECVLYLQSSRTGDTKIFVATRPK